ncbi:hypothetical protein FF125_15870 [Aureibaculum algae]|uniref:Glycosyl hydrolase-like 10 domain-containing protein n=1 Tax=Aureibaculum algae TaxID=2584122 RepID=A0A5B7TX42_9FLAO|nr:hypothetical protein [Aureibaculum algae]QCX39844.1 hypothetical protein FF125_15870 [Aureibaculum algae]
MNKILIILLISILFISCKDKSDTEISKSKVPVYAWTGGPGEATDAELLTSFKGFKDHGVDGLMYNGGQNPETYKRVGKIAKEAGLEFHTWIPTMRQDPNDTLTADLFGVNGEGDSAFDKPVYAKHYTFLCPNKEKVVDYLTDLYGKIADVEEVDGIHLDYIRFPDVILARGLWEKYDLVMDKEFPKFDYCYCDKCKADFKEQSGIDINEVEDPSQVQEWKQFRYDLITNMVNKIAEVVHAKGKQLNAAVFPGPSLAKKMVRQEWEKWDLDAIFPMNYNDFYLEDTKWVGEMVKEEVASVNNAKPIYSGLFITPFPNEKAEHPDPEDHGVSPEELVDAIEQSMINGAAGICLFTPGRMTDEHWKVFKEAIYKDYSKTENSSE